MGIALNIYRKTCDHFRKRSLKRRIFFLHIPKCGGTSIDRALMSHYNSLFGVSKDSSIHLDAEASFKASQLCGMDLGRYREHLLIYFMGLKNTKYVSGHFPFSDTAFHEFSSDWDFITILRHPVSRWFSHYFFNRYKKSDHFRIHNDLEAFVDSDLGKSLGHYYVSILTGHGGASSSIPTEAVDETISILEKFTLVGCLERIEPFVRQFKDLYQIQLNIGKKNRNPLSKLDQQEQISKTVRRKVENICQPDIEVYKFVLSRLPRQE